MEMGVGEVSRLLDVERDLLKRWAFIFQDYLSLGANPSKGASRKFELQDLQVFLYVSRYWEDQPDIEAIKIGLNLGHHINSIHYENMRASLLPIFQEPPEELDETWEHGCLVGGMCGDVVDKLTLAESYKLAGDILIDTALTSDEPYTLLFPAVYSYRHAVELYLKAVLLPSKKNHDLKPLYQKLHEILKKEHNTAIPSWFENLILALDDFDPGSTTFRYGNSGVFPHSTGDRGEIWIDLQHMKKIMHWASDAFQRIKCLLQK